MNRTNRAKQDRKIKPQALRNLAEIFQKAADTGRKDDMQAAARAANRHDNFYQQSDLIGRLSHELGQKAKIIRDGFFTASNGLKEPAREAFRKLAHEAKTNADTTEILNFQATQHNTHS